MASFVLQVYQLDGHQLRNMGVLPEHCEKIMENVSVLKQSYMGQCPNDSFQNLQLYQSVVVSYRTMHHFSNVPAIFTWINPHLK